VCCSALQCVAVCCSGVKPIDLMPMVQCVAVSCSVLQCVAVCCSVLQWRKADCLDVYCCKCVAVCRTELQ